MPHWALALVLLLSTNYLICKLFVASEKKFHIKIKNSSVSKIVEQASSFQTLINQLPKIIMLKMNLQSQNEVLMIRRPRTSCCIRCLYTVNSRYLKVEGTL